MLGNFDMRTVNEKAYQMEILQWISTKKHGTYDVQTIYDWAPDRLFKVSVRRIILRIYPEEKSPYYFGSKIGYDVELIIPESMPWSPPYVRFCHKTWHPGINLITGLVNPDFSVVNPETWSPNTKLSDIVVGIGR